MAFLPTTQLLRSRTLSRLQYTCTKCRPYATPSLSGQPAPPLLLKLRNDLKTAMKEKDTNRLNVLRSLLADVTNSAKSNNSIKSDMQLLSLLRKRQAAAKQAIDESKRAGREDLVAKEESQVDVLEEYAGNVETVSLEDIREIIMKVVEEVKTEQPAGKVNAGDVLKKLLRPGGSLEGMAVEKGEVARIVKEVLSMS